MKMFIFIFCLILCSVKAYCNHLSILNADNLTRGTLPNERLDDSSVTQKGSMNTYQETIYISSANAYIISVTTLSLNGIRYTFPSIGGTNGQILNTDGNGNLTWITPPITSTSNIKIDLIITSVTVSQMKITATQLDIMGFNAVQISTIVDISKSGIAGLDTGSELPNTWYSIFAISNGSTMSVVLSSAPNFRPTLPSGFTKWSKIGYVYNDVNSNFLPIYKKGDYVTYWIQQEFIEYADISESTLFTGDLYPLVSPGANCVDLHFLVRAQSATNFVFSVFGTGQDINVSAGNEGSKNMLDITGVNDSLMSFSNRIPLMGTQSFKYRCDASCGATNIWVLGYEEKL